MAAHCLKNNPGSGHDEDHCERHDARDVVLDEPYQVIARSHAETTILAKVNGRTPTVLALTPRRTRPKPRPTAGTAASVPCAACACCNAEHILDGPPADR